MKLLIIRHAESANNRLAHDLEFETYMAKRYADPPLTELGQQQAHALAQHLAHDPIPEHTSDGFLDDTLVGYGVTKLFCSAMLRSLQTARPIGAALGLQPEVWVDVHEHGGLFSGNPRAEEVVSVPGQNRASIAADFPGYVVPEAVSDAGWWWDGYEDMPGCYARATRVAAQLRKRAQDGHGQDEREFLAVVSHGTFIDCLIKALFKQIPERDLFYLHYNTALTRIDFRPDGALLLRYLDRVRHLRLDQISY